MIYLIILLFLSFLVLVGMSCLASYLWNTMIKEGTTEFYRKREKKKGDVEDVL